MISPQGFGRLAFTSAHSRENRNLRKFRSWQVLCLVLVFCAATAIASRAQSAEPLYSFCSPTGCGTQGFSPEAGLVQGADGNFYGITFAGGTGEFSSCQVNGCGTIFKITPQGALTTLYNFCSQPNCADGFGTVGLVQGTDGNFYGAMAVGGTMSSTCSSAGCGTIFKITPEGALTTLYNFCSQPSCSDGSGSQGALVQGADGNFYGTTYSGGMNDSDLCGKDGCGTVFKITPQGTLTSLYSFCSQRSCTDGKFPAAGLAQGTDGNFYGTTSAGGTKEGPHCPNSGCGTIFKITPQGTLTTLYSFCSQPNCADGTIPPEAPLFEASNGNFYGATDLGGNQACNLGCGTIFEITPEGTFTTLHTFDGTDGYSPAGGLIQAADGNLYGVTPGGGPPSYAQGGAGTLFQITPGGAFTTIYTFCKLLDCVDGASPTAPLVQGSNGNFYGTTSSGGEYGALSGVSGDGTFFLFSQGTLLYVETVPTSGKVGTGIAVVGDDLRGATSVSFNGTAAKFKVLSKTSMKATVPSGATTGTVTVTTPNGTLRGVVPFLVIPQIKKFTPKKGPIGIQVQITGTSFSQTTVVAFGGVTATSFTVNSNTEVTATVPVGAQTGPITITTAGGTATSTGTFKVTE